MRREEGRLLAAGIDPAQEHLATLGIDQPEATGAHAAAELGVPGVGGRLGRERGGAEGQEREGESVGPGLHGASFAAVVARRAGALHHSAKSFDSMALSELARTSRRR